MRTSAQYMNEYKEIRTKDGRRILLLVDECSMEIQAKNMHGEVIGCFGFREIEDPNGSYFLICRMDVGGFDKQFIRQGIGRQVLLFAKEHWGLAIIAQSDDGLRRTDGSHLTGDAPAFVAAMLTEGVLVPGDREQQDLLEAINTHRANLEADVTVAKTK